MAQDAEFLELCKLARELEKRAMDILPTPISGDLAHEGSDIFPREFEDYTYSYLLVEAHNIERKLFAATYTQQLSSQTSDSQMADELSNFASDGSYGQSRGKSGAIAKMPSVKTPSPMPPPSDDSQNPNSDEPLPPPSRNEIDIARETEAEGERRREAFFPPKPSQTGFQSPSYKNEEDATGAMPSEAADEGKKEPPPPRQFADSSKISPRLRAIIEAKLRREEEREGEEGQLEKAKQTASQGAQGEEAGQMAGQQAKESIRFPPQKPYSKARLPLGQTDGSSQDELPSESSGQPHQEAWEKPNQEENEPPALSARERLLRSLQKETREARKNADGPPPEMETPAAPPIQSEQEGPEKAPEEEPASLGQQEAIGSARQKSIGEKAAEEKAIEQRGIEEKAIWEKTPREEETPSRVSSHPASRPGSLLIRPVFPEEHSSSQSEESASRENERSAKIQKIIDELSFDRQKASAVSRPPQETQMEMKGEGSESQEESEERRAQEPSGLQVPADEGNEGEEAAAQKTTRRQMAKAPIPNEDEEEQRKDEIRKKMEAIFQKPKKQMALQEPSEEGQEDHSPPSEPPSIPPSEKRLPSKTQPVARQKAPASIPKRMAETNKARQTADAPESKKGKKPQAQKTTPISKASKKAIPSSTIANPSGMPSRPVRTPSAYGSPSPKTPSTTNRTPKTPPVSASASPPPKPQGTISRKKNTPPPTSSRAPSASKASAPPPPPIKFPSARSVLPPALASSQVKPLGFQIPPRDYPPTTAAPKTFRPPQLTPEPRAAYPTDSSDENAAHASYRQQANPASARKVAAPPPATKTYLPPLRTKAPPPPPPPDDEGEEGNEEQPPIRRQPQEADAPILKFPLFKRTAQVPTGNDEESEIPIPPPPPSQGIDLAGLAKRKKEISGEAQLSQEEDDDIEAPRPPSQADSIPAAEQYGEAKEGFKRKLEQMELKEKAKGSSDEMIEEYAKENITWLYEIYKMGGMEREDFLAEARENMAPSGLKREQEGEPPPNPALEALSKEIEKKKKQE